MYLRSKEGYMIVITGAAGFIASCLAKHIQSKSTEKVVLVDDFGRAEKKRNYDSLLNVECIDRTQFFDWIESSSETISIIYHLGARTDTTEFDKTIFDDLNVAYSKKMWDLAIKHKASFIYASSAATYGNGELGYDDKLENIEDLKPLNPYGDSKLEFDIWVKNQSVQPKKWAGLKFFNVYGPNEYHKGRMASVIMHAFNQISSTGGMKLFRSHNSNYKDGGQLRDFIYFKDLIKIIDFLVIENIPSGIYNVGTGKARTFEDLALATFKAMGVDANISFIDTPKDIRDKYQYFTEADMNKLESLGFEGCDYSLESGVEDYVKNYLTSSKYF